MSTDWIVVVFFLIFLIGYLIFTLISFISHFTGAPFVPTGGGDVEEILRNANLKKGELFIELGSGEGRVVRTAVKRYGVKGVGIEINPYLVVVSYLFAFLFGVKEISFKTANLYKTDIKKADVIYMYLLPTTLEKLKDKLSKESKKGALIISQGFRIKGWDKYITKTLERKWFNTYYYKLR